MDVSFFRPNRELDEMLTAKQSEENRKKVLCSSEGELFWAHEKFICSFSLTFFFAEDEPVSDYTVQFCLFWTNDCILNHPFCDPDDQHFTAMRSPFSSICLARWKVRIFMSFLCNADALKCKKWIILNPCTEVISLFSENTLQSLKSFLSMVWCITRKSVF